MIALRAGLLALSSLLAVVHAAPRMSVRDSSVNEPAVFAPDGTPITEGTPEATQLSKNNDNSNSNSYGGSSYGSSNSYGGSSYGGSENSNSYGGNSYGSSNSYGDNSYGGSENSNSYGGNSYGGSDNSYGGSDNSYNGGSYNNNYSSESWNTVTASSENAMYTEASNTYTSEESSYTPPSSYSPPSYSPPSYSPPSYGSGGNSWGNNGYDNCVQQCMATYGAPPSMYTPPSSYDSPPSSGSGKVWKVTVAPHQGVLRYVPFAINASVGDTIRFMWGANKHTVTKSSVLEVCNKSSDNPFTSGIQNQSFIFDQVVNSTDTTFFYCGVPNHCQQGMFGVINPPNAGGESSSVGMMMPMAAQNDSDMFAQMSYTMKQTEGDDTAWNWGSSMDMSKLGLKPEYAPMFYQNVMFTRLMMAANKDAVQDGVFNPTGDAPFVVPGDISLITSNGANNAAAPNPSGAAPVSSATQAVGNAASPTPSSPALRSATSSTGAVAFAAIAAAYFAL